MKRFVIQEHHAGTHHFDLRLEKASVFVSWAVPRGIPGACGTKRLAIQVEDHALSFGDFEGEIAEGEYGAGGVRVWDRGEYHPLEWTDERIVVRLTGRRVEGIYALIRFPRGGERAWLVFKKAEAG